MPSIFTYVLRKYLPRIQNLINEVKYGDGPEFFLESHFEEQKKKTNYR